MLLEQNWSGKMISHIYAYKRIDIANRNTLPETLVELRLPEPSPGASQKKKHGTHYLSSSLS
ncbi:MAG: hypothetical protein DF168_01645 [Candidatus Moanabacter tarae]|uniref:Uncharacterized protein n=1 Tax=Candidatus Moanibacter tarae TaxID=2200854 RepID=A0A2Z4AR46_9BACT|nr:MAG: hypothetical protein DF168_01645 [Candidatus Moanabacter tarae]